MLIFQWYFLRNKLPEIDFLGGFTPYYILLLAQEGWDDQQMSRKSRIYRNWSFRAGEATLVTQ
ncbi:MAG: hypothetical protein F6K37_03800 [Moorea sp. SIO4E2]|nr:hypothetical protein [Moorena sp. SIO4E2]